MRGRRVTWVTVGVIVVAVALRFAGLGGWDMWTDEVQTLRMAASGEFWFGPMYRTAPINFWLTGWAVDLFGANELGLRAVPALAGSVTVAVLFFVARRWLDDRAALFATAVLALSFWHVAWSQTGRHFALQALVVMGALHAFLLYWLEGKKTALGLAAGLLLSGLFVHSSTGFYVAAFLFVVLLSAIPRLGSSGPDRGLDALWPKPAVPALVLSAPLLLYLPIFFGVGSYLMETRSAWNPPWNILGSFGFYLTPVVLAFAAGGAVHLWRRDRRLCVTLLSLAVVPMVLLTAASSLTIASAAYCLPSMVAVAMLAGSGCDGLLRATSGGRAATVAAGLVVAGLFLVQARDLVEYYTFQNGLKPRWREATSYVRQHRAAGETVWAAEGDVAQYYLGEDGVRWMGEFRAAESTERTAREGAWFILYTQDRPELNEMIAPALRADELPREARFEALYPLSYGPKDRTLIVLHRPGSVPAQGDARREEP